MDQNQDNLNFLPVAVILTSEILKQKKISWSFALLFLLLNLLISRFWLPLNHGSRPSLENSHPTLTLDFPMQWYFMNFGPWVSNSMYWVSAVSVSFLYFLLYLTLEESLAKNRNLT